MATSQQELKRIQAMTASSLQDILCGHHRWGISGQPSAGVGGHYLPTPQIATAASASKSDPDAEVKALRE